MAAKCQFWNCNSTNTRLFRVKGKEIDNVFPYCTEHVIAVVAEPNGLSVEKDQVSA